MNASRTRCNLPAAWGLSLLAFLLTAGPAGAYNSEEHKLVVDQGVSRVKIPTIIRAQLANYVQISTNPTDAQRYLDDLGLAKKLAVGFATNNPKDFDPYKKHVQDNCFYKGSFCQVDYNVKIHLPSLDDVPNGILSVVGQTDSSPTFFTLGEYAALYGDYRRTTHCPLENPAACYLTDQDVQFVKFSKGANASSVYCPGQVPGRQYLQAIGSGVVPPFGCAGNVTSNTVGDGDFDEAGWWGDEMLRIANVNDWHFSRAAVAWYVGLHRMALQAAQAAQPVGGKGDNRQWVRALHLEANALHSLTDLFALGHVVTNRDATSYGIMKDSSLTKEPAYQWMEEVIRAGSGVRDQAGRVTLTGSFPIPMVPSYGVRNDFLRSYRGTWVNYAKNEKNYHDQFNDRGATVINLRGESFSILGDGKLNTTGAAQKIMRDAVTASVQSLFDAAVKLEAGESFSKLTSPGSSYFEALKYLPVFIQQAKDSPYLDGRWALYAGAIDTISGAGVVPTDWAKCQIPFIDGGNAPPGGGKPCTTFPKKKQ
jgi:hypothetical protein